MFHLELDSGEPGGYIVVALRGELDLMYAAAVTTALASITEPEPRIIVDLSGLQFVDAAGVRALARGREEARAAGGDLWLAAPMRGVQRILALIWESDGSRVYDSVAVAVSEGSPLAVACAAPPSAR